MSRHKSFSGHKINVTPPLFQPYCIPFSTASNKKKKSVQITPQVSDWFQLLQEISEVTNKVKKLYYQDKKHTSRPKGNIKMSRNTNFSKCQESRLTQSQKHILTAKKQSKNNQNSSMSCNPECHALMHECIKLNHQNKKLIEQKQMLQKRLYFQSKEKRQLRWKLERQKQKEMSRYGKDIFNNNSFTLKLQKDINHINSYEDPTRYQISQSSYMTAKKTSPLKQRDNNIIKLHSVPMNNSKQDDSLLIDFSVRGDQNMNQKKSQDLKNYKLMESINLEKDLNELLEVCKYEADKDKKRIIRRQMKQLAQKIRKLKNY